MTRPAIRPPTIGPMGTGLVAVAISAVLVVVVVVVVVARALEGMEAPGLMVVLELMVAVKTNVKGTGTAVQAISSDSTLVPKIL
jgi:hypothetical protein